MNKKVLKGMVKNYFSNNNRMLGIFAFTFILMILLIVLTNDQENKLALGLMMTGTFVFVLLVIYWKVWYIQIKALLDIKHERVTKKNVRFKEVYEDKTWILWNTGAKSGESCKYIGIDEEGNEYRFATNCNYQTVEAVERFVQKTTLRIVVLENTKLVLSIQHNPADFKDKKESQEVGEITKKLFGVFCFPFNYKKHD